MGLGGLGRTSADGRASSNLAATNAASQAAAGSPGSLAHCKRVGRLTVLRTAPLRAGACGQGLACQAGSLLIETAFGTAHTGADRQVLLRECLCLSLRS